MFARRGGPSIYNQSSGGGSSTPFSEVISLTEGGAHSVWTENTLTVTHGMNTTEPVIVLRDTVTNQLLSLPINSTAGANVLVLEFIEKPANAFKVTIRT